jgi:hypothetical protein
MIPLRSLVRTADGRYTHREVGSMSGSARWLDLGHAAIDAQFDAGHEAAVIGGQKHCSGCDLFGALTGADGLDRCSARTVPTGTSPDGATRD